MMVKNRECMSQKIWGGGSVSSSPASTWTETAHPEHLFPSRGDVAFLLKEGRMRGQEGERDDQREEESRFLMRLDR